jgi:CheY-like chemotaxis protein
MNGYEAAARVRELPGEKYQKLPIIAFSASGKNEPEEHLKAVGINDFVSKPFAPHELFAKINAYADLRVSSSPVVMNGNQPGGCLPAGIARIGMPSDNPFDLSGCVALAGDNRENLAQLVQISLEELVNYKVAFSNCLRREDVTTLDRLAHRSKVTINLLKAKKIDTLVHQAQKQLREESNQAVRQELISALEAAFDAIIDGLKGFSSPGE